MKYEDCKNCVANENNIDDLINPETGLGLFGKKTVENMVAKGGELMSVEEFYNRKFAKQNTPLEWAEVDADSYDEAMGCVPPIDLSSSGFLVGEPWDHCAKTGAPRFTAYRFDGVKYTKSNRPMTRKEFTTI